jgi:RNA polymerase sigma-70 factor, ECF subfamily
LFDSGEDGDLMRRLLADDTVAFSVMYDRHAGSVYGLALRILRDRTAAEDVAQEAFAALWRCRHRYSAERGSASAWLLTITRNRAIDAIRRGRGHHDAPLEGHDDREAPDRTDDEALRRVDAAVIGGALRTLPDAQRLVLELGYFSGLTHYEIAAALQVPLGTVKSRTRLGLQKLATQLDDPATGSGIERAQPTLAMVGGEGRTA